jgi:transcriptional regulator with XRE-family HTH domain
VNTGTAGARNAIGDDLGRRLRQARQSKHVGLRELARQIGVSASLISQIETGKSAPSVSTLTAIVNALDIPANEVFSFGDDLSDGSVDSRDSDVRRRPLPNTGVAVSRSPLQRRNKRQSITLDSGVVWDRLTPQPDHDVDFLYVRYPPGGASTASESLMRHNGREYGYVISGRLQVSIGFDVYELGPGDSIAFDSSEPHRLATIGDQTCEAIWFVLGRRHFDSTAADTSPTV